MADNKDKCYVYRYIDMNDNKIKYVGIVIRGTMPNRHKEHMKDKWYKDGVFICECIEVNNQSEAEAIESHLIALYETDKYYNKAKAGWGINKYLPIEYDWKIASTNETLNDVVKGIQIYSDWVLQGRKTNKEISKAMDNYAQRILKIQKEYELIEQWHKH